jgi:hypothetical protein
MATDPLEADSAAAAANAVRDLREMEVDGGEEAVKNF